MDSNPRGENNAKCGWTPEKAVENEAKAQAKYDELRKRIATLRP